MICYNNQVATNDIPIYVFVAHFNSCGELLIGKLLNDTLCTSLKHQN